MKYFKTLGLLIAIAAVLMGLAGTATATVVTAPAGTLYTGPVHASSHGYIATHNGVGTIECKSTFEGKVVSHGQGVTATIQLTTWHFTGCTGGTVHPVTTPGHLEIHNIGGGKGTVTSTGAKITKTIFGVECGYTTNNTHIGELTPAPSGSGHATIHLTGSIPRTHGSFFCGSSANWTGSFRVNTPTGLTIS
jgi:hypothetical protein